MTEHNTIKQIPYEVINKETAFSNNKINISKERPFVQLKYRNEKFLALIDTGADTSFISSDIIKKSQIPIKLGEIQTNLAVGSTKTLGTADIEFRIINCDLVLSCPSDISGSCLKYLTYIDTMKNLRTEKLE